MNEACLIFYAVIAFCVYALYKGIKAILFLTKKIPEEIRQQYKFTIILKSLFLNERHWITDINEAHLSLFYELNTFWHKHTKQLFIAWCLLIALILFAVIPSIIFLIKN